MSAPKFTPGPWEIGRVDSAGNRLVVAGGGRGVVAEIRKGAQQIPAEEKAHNARLIAAAPDLYAVLREAVDQIDAKFTEKGEEIVAHRVQYPKLLGRARAALAKAEGSQ